MLTDAEIAAVLASPEPVEWVSEMLVRQAKARGGRDNVTVVVIEVCADEESRAPVKRVNLQELYASQKKLTRLMALLGAVNLYFLFEWIDFFFLK